MKTKEVSERLGVNPTTVQRWAKYFGFACETNEHGHYVFTEKHVEMMRNVQIQLKEGKRMKDIQFDQPKEEEVAESNSFIQTSVYEEKLEAMITRLDELDEKISKKADDVVSYQLLKHRTELEEMMNMIKNLEDRLTRMENKIQPPRSINEDELPMVVGGNTKPKKRRSFMQLFSF